jgi:hypothetical protein
MKYSNFDELVVSLSPIIFDGILHIYKYSHEKCEKNNAPDKIIIFFKHN